MISFGIGDPDLATPDSVIERLKQKEGCEKTQKRLAGWRGVKLANVPVAPNVPVEERDWRDKDDWVAEPDDGETRETYSGPPS